jgi:hypothetical protein
MSCLVKMTPGRTVQLNNFFYVIAYTFDMLLPYIRLQSEESWRNGASINSVLRVHMPDTATRWVCKKNRPNCIQTHFVFQFLHILSLGKKVAQKRALILQFSKKLSKLNNRPLAKISPIRSPWCQSKNIKDAQIIITVSLPGPER